MHSIKPIALTFAVIVVLMTVTTSKADATPITYTVQATADGQLGTSTFTNALVTLTFTGDTSTVMPGSGFINPIGPVSFITAPGTATLNVAGIGTGTFVGPAAAFVVQMAERPSLPPAGIGTSSGN